MRSETLIVLAAAALAAQPAHSRSPKPAERVMDLVEKVRVNLPAGAKEFRLWIPKPPTDEVQSAKLVEVKAPWPHRVTSDPEFGNEILFLEAQSPKEGPVEIELRYRISRKEQRPAAVQGRILPQYTQPRGLVVVNDEVRLIASKTAGGLSDPYEKARALYYYVFSRMAYDKSGQGWGRGDVLNACKTGKGNCTDFHSLFIALAMAEGIPARFRIGYPLPSAPAGDVESPYHCWAEFHVQGRGWIPVDISEAWKRPSRADYFFGRLDEDRVLVSTGRDITLSPVQKGEPLNYLVRPYAEADGSPVFDLEVRRSYKDIVPSKT